MFNKDDILSNKIIMSHDGILYQVCRKKTACAFLSELSYNIVKWNKNY